MAAPGQPCWIDITVNSADDRERLVAFLCDLFDWTFEASGPEVGYYTMLRRNGVDVAAVGQQPEGGGRWVTFFAAPDIEASVASVTDNGGQVFMGPHTVMRAGTLAVGVDPTGAVFGLWQPDLFAGFGETIAAGHPVWFDHGSPDPAAANGFYTSTFGLEATAPDGDAMVGRDGRWYFSVSRNVAGNAPDIKPVIMVEDLDSLEDTVRAAGGEIYASAVELPSGGRATTFADPVVGAPLIAFSNSA